MTTTVPTTPVQTADYGPSATAAEPRGLGIASLVLGIVSILTGGGAVIGPVAGLVLGCLALTREPASRTMAIWGIVLNAVVLGLGAIALVGTAVFTVAMLPFAIF